MRTPSEREHGIVAILDALGAATYGDTEIKRFIDSRRLVLQLPLSSTLLPNDFQEAVLAAFLNSQHIPLNVAYCIIKGHLSNRIRYATLFLPLLEGITLRRLKHLNAAW